MVETIPCTGVITDLQGARDRAGAALGAFAVFWGLGLLIACGVPIAAKKAQSQFVHD